MHPLASSISFEDLPMDGSGFHLESEPSTAFVDSKVGELSKNEKGASCCYPNLPSFAAQCGAALPRQCLGIAPALRCHIASAERPGG